MHKRETSLILRRRDGDAARDSGMTLSATARGLGVSFYACIHARVSSDRRQFLEFSIPPRFTQQKPLLLGKDFAHRQP